MAQIYTNRLLTHPNGSTAGLGGALVVGTNPLVNADEDVWPAGVAWAAPKAGRRHNLASVSALDDAASTGARSVLVSGLDDAFNPISETVALSGVTPVLTTQSFFRINQLAVTEWGGTEFNQGDISCTAETDLTASAYILEREGTALQAIFTVPAGVTGHLTGLGGSLNRTGGGLQPEMLLKMEARENPPGVGPGWRTIWKTGFTGTGTSSGQSTKFTPAGVFPERTDVRMCVASVIGTDLDVSAWFTLLLVQNA